MTTHGTVNAKREPMVTVTVRGPDGATVDVVAIVDTGFTGWLTLPAQVVGKLNAQQAATRTVRLGDGTLHRTHSYDIDVNLCDTWHSILVYATGHDALIGTRLLLGHEVRVEVTIDGAVEITPLP